MITKIKALLQKIDFSTPQGIQRTIWIVAAALLINVLLFGGYYYWDRYVHVGDQSQTEMGIAELETAVREDPNDPDKRVMLAEYYLSSGLPDKALEQTAQVLESIPDHEGALLISGVAFTRLNQPENAVEPLKHFVFLRKDSPMASSDTVLEMAYYFLGESYLKINRPLDAIEPLESAIQISPTDADALYQLGLAFNATEKPEEALPYFDRAVRLVPDFTEAYSGMIESYTSLEKPELIAYARGMEAFSQRDFETAQTYLEYAAQTLPDYSPAFLGLALTYEQLDQLDFALISVTHALDLDPDNFAAQQTFGRLQATIAAQES
ncbi:MAG: tetratricopeptide repeat protein [Anaerolineae bacterium]|jgi:tetratricopeptide (TPR) repeat protein|nr:tetratricopeptide repeat protein [Anaerolineae bacterium]MBT7190667.1 tetratricopeptide repeat protein [Anaerolineae bacterium]MBT7991307.1 tetratricopeptide repeat protein [Anaerolineae bacterium]